jgi:hypothetical protein
MGCNRVWRMLLRYRKKAGSGLRHAAGGGVGLAACARMKLSTDS